MRIEYDQTADALYIRLVDGETIVSRTEQVDAGTLVDLDEHGMPLGIEVIRPARPVPIHEIAARFHITQAAIDVLAEWWRDQLGNDSRFPFAGSSNLTATG